jgi:Reverse transcriptase (RNA-dependent DNA polymerase)
MYTDTMKAVTMSSRMNEYAQVYTIPPMWIKCYAMKARSDAPETLKELLRDVGAPEKFIMDGSKEQSLGDFRKACRDAGCKIHVTEPYSPWSNQAELAIRELKKSTRRKMIASDAPARLWDDCIELEADIISHTAHDSYALQGQTPHTVVTGHTCDISKYAEFRWYQWIMWYDSVAKFPNPKNVLGRYLGPTRDMGMALSAKILCDTGKTIFRSSFIALSEDQMKNPIMIKRMNRFDRAVARTLGTSVQAMNAFQQDATPDYIPYEDDNDKNAPYITPERDDIEDSAYDPYVGAEVLLPQGYEQRTAKVIGRKRDANGDLIGHANSNPILDTRQYDVEFPDGAEASYSANILAENMLSQCDSEGRQYLLVKYIIDHVKEAGTAIEESDAFITVNGRKSRIKTTKGWKLCVEWTDGTTSWVPLATLKEQVPVEVAEYAVTKSIDKEPAFAWWVPWTLKKRESIISAVNNRHLKRTHKFGIELPQTVEEAHELDRRAGNTKWGDAITKEMTNVMIAFKLIGKGAPIPPGHQKIKCHIIFDVKMDNFARKARMVAGGHVTEPPASITYASVVARDSIRVALTMAALHDLEVKAGDIQNAYLTAKCRESIATICGPEFGDNQGQTAIIVRALYGLKSSGAAFRNHLAKAMRELGYTSCPADPDVWMRPETRGDGFKYYAYVLLYVDDALVINHDGMKALNEINARFKMKPDSMGDPDIYLGCKMSQHILPNGVKAWLQSPSKYIQEAVRNAEVYFTKEFGMPFRRKVRSPFTSDYRPELDGSEELNTDMSSRYQSDIGILRWIVEIGRIDIITEVSLLASHLALPRMGHLMQVWHIYAFLKNRHNGCIIFDPTYPTIKESDFNAGGSWRDAYGDITEPLPPDAPQPRGKEAVIRVFVDADHAGEKLTRRSRTGFLIYLNMAPIIWYSKRQGTVETSVFGSEFVAMKNATEAARGLRYKLRMMGIPVLTPNYIYGDNMSVIHNTQRAESMLKKKSLSICYHFMRESVAMGESLTGHIRSEDNPADICTKVIGGGMKRDRLTDKILFFASNLSSVATKSAKKLKKE